MTEKKIFKNDGSRRVAIIGEGASGMMAALWASKNMADTVIFEKNDRPGKKLRITGKGRCNVTNNCSVDEFLSNIPTNPRFLYSALNCFPPEETMKFFEECGVKLKTERGKRVFPESDRAIDIVMALSSKCRECGVNTVREKITSLYIDDGRVKGVYSGDNLYECDAVIVCTGGMSYPLTGSDGDGYKFAKTAGHSIIPPKPSLVPIVCRGRVCGRMQGLSLKNIGFRVYEKGRQSPVYEDFGELMFTHFGITGPVVLSASAHLSDVDSGKYTASIDFKPALDFETLDRRILSDFTKYRNRDFINSLDDLLPQKSIEPVIEASEIDMRKKVNSVTKEERHRLADTVKNFKIELSGFRPISEAIITKGGVSTKEINPKSMESRLVSGLYFAGEVIDVDGYTGGFNLQIAFSTAALAGGHAALGF